MTIFSDIGRYLLMIKGMFARPENGKMYWKELIHQCTEIGFGSLGIVAIISVFIGAVSTIQTAYQLVSPLIPPSTIAQIVRDTVVLEFAPTLVCIVLAGVAGSRIASELGNMRVSEQIDALEIMGIKTKTYLVLPKVIAALIMIPLLVVIAMALGIWGGRLAGVEPVGARVPVQGRGGAQAVRGGDGFREGPVRPPRHEPDPRAPPDVAGARP